MADTEAIRPYLAPDYWNGHTIGDGDAESLPPSDNVYARSLGYLHRELPRRLNRNNVVFPLETFSNGEVFDVNDYEPGTVLLYRDEMLTSAESGSQRQDTPDNYQSVTLRPYDLTPYVSAEDTMLYLEGEQVNYLSIGMWGMVVSTRNARKTVVSTPISNVQPHVTGEIKVVNTQIIFGAPSTPQSFPSRIGEARHFKLPSGMERLARVNILQVIAYGQVQRARRQFFGLGRLATHSS